MKTLTTTIKREFLEEIVSGSKRIEYREIKPYWTEKLATVTAPFLLRLINGMSAVAPEVTVEIARVVKNRTERCYEFHIANVTSAENLPGPAHPRGQRLASSSKSLTTGAFFFLWNPDQDQDSFRNLTRIIKDSTASKPYVRDWLCRSTRPAAGDRAYLQRTGPKNNGVFARGTVDSNPHKSLYGNRIVQLRLVDFLPIGAEIPRDEIISEARYAKRWAPYASGNVIPLDILAALDTLWKARAS